MAMTHPAIVDDSGLGLDGTVWNNAWETAHDTAIDTAIAAAVAGISGGSHSVCDGRLTLTAGVPVTTADVVGATSVKFTPFRGDKVGLYNGTAWVIRTFAETSLALGTLTNDLPYDLFAYDNAGTLALELLAWTSKTARATALALQDGVFVKTGATTRRYLGTFHTTSTTTTEDSLQKRLLWNYYNRVPRLMRRTTSASWTYTTATVRQANADTANFLAVVVGVAEVVMDAQVNMNSRNTNASVASYTGIGLDSTTTLAPGCMANYVVSPGATIMVPTNCTLRDQTPIGYHVYNWLEYSDATGTTSWFSGSLGPILGGIHGITQA
jgi:hypothetical protein